MRCSILLPKSVFALLWLLAGVPCWAASSYAIERVQVRDGHPIRDTEGVLFQQSFDDECVAQWDQDTETVRSFAGSISSEVEIHIRLMGCGTEVAPSASCEWQINPLHQRKVSRRDTITWEGWETRFRLPLPSFTGEARFSLHCSMGASQDEMETALFTTYRAPTPLVTLEGAPEQEWYRRAVEWGGGFQANATEEDILRQMVQRQYDYGSQKWRYGSFPSAATEKIHFCFDSGFCYCPWRYLVAAQVECDFANCYQFSNTFESLASTLGIGGFGYTILEGEGGAGILTKTDLASVDPRFQGNSRCDGSTEHCPAYVFGTHNLRYRDGYYFDPTYGSSYRGRTDGVAMSLKSTASDNGCRISFEDGKTVLCPRKDDDFYGQWTRWAIYTVKDEADIAQIGMAPPEQQGSISNITVAPELASGPGPHMTLQGTLQVPQAGLYHLMGALLKDGVPVATHGVTGHQDVSLGQFKMAAHTPLDFTIKLSADQILRSGLTPPFTMKLSLFDRSGIVAVYSQEMAMPSLPNLRGEDDSIAMAVAIPPTAILPPNAQALTVRVKLSGSEEEKVLLQVRLAKDGTTIDYGGVLLDKVPASGWVDVEIPAESIRASGLQPPYQAIVGLYETGQQPLDSACFSLGGPGAGCTPDWEVVWSGDD